MYIKVALGDARNGYQCDILYDVQDKLRTQGYSTVSARTPYGDMFLLIDTNSDEVSLVSDAFDKAYSEVKAGAHLPAMTGKPCQRCEGKPCQRYPIREE